jgi:Flp pilus assembly protein TadD
MTTGREELARAATMLDLGRYDEAGRLLAQVVADEPTNGRAWCLFARAHLGAGRYPEAVSAASRAAALSPDDEWPHRLASNAMMHLGRHQESLNAARESCKLAPSYWQTHVCVAQAALAAGQLKAAESSASEARRLAPSEPDVHFLSGKVSLARGELHAARSHQERALALDPAHSGAMNELGRIRLRRHDTSGAIRHFISAARTTPAERIYSRNIEVVILRGVSRMIYLFTLLALVLIWVPAVIQVKNFPFGVAVVLLAVLMGLCFGVFVSRMPREARRLVRHTLRSRRVAQALTLAVGGVAVAFGIVAFVPADEVPQILPIAVILTVAARIAAFATLRTTLGR